MLNLLYLVAVMERNVQFGAFQSEVVTSMSPIQVEIALPASFLALDDILERVHVGAHFSQDGVSLGYDL